MLNVVRVTLFLKQSRRRQIPFRFRVGAVVSARLKFRALAAVSVTLLLVVCGASLCSARAASADSRRKTKKAPPLPSLPSGPLGPIPQIPLDSIAPIAPEVSFEKGQLTIVALNSTLGAILRAVRQQTGAEIEIPSANERVVIHLGPGSAREVIAELLNGSRFNYVLIGSHEDPSLLTHVVLVLRTAPEIATPNGQLNGQPQHQPVTTRFVNPDMQPQQPQIADPDAVPYDPEFNTPQGAGAAPPVPSPQPIPANTPAQDPD